MSSGSLRNWSPKDEYKKIMRLLNGIDSNPPAGTMWYLISKSWWNNWKNYCKSGDSSSAPGEIDSSDLLLPTEDFLQDVDDDESPENSILKPGLQIDGDLKIIPGSAWRLLKQKYSVKPKSEIKRFSIEISEFATQIEIYLRPVKFTWITSRSYDPVFFPEPFTFYISNTKLIRSIKSKILSLINQNSEAKKIMDHRHIRLWKLNSEMDKEEFTKFVSENDNKLNNSVKADFPGKFLSERDDLDESEVAHSDVIVAEIKTSAVDWRFKHVEVKAAPTMACGYCRKPVKNVFSCACKQLDFCSNNCLQMSKDIHECKIEFTSEPLKAYSRNERSRLGLTGLQNLGNTCFMNSAIQCLSSTGTLTDFLLTKDIEGLVNRTNPLGSGGKLALEYCRLVYEIWYSSQNYYSPWSFKRAVAAFSPQFRGVEQHDSSEFLNFLLDGLHEDLNQITQKPYFEDPGYEKLPEKENAALQWTHHTARNQSIIVDLMHGQYRSELTWPKCASTSLWFDPFLMHAVQIPRATSVSVQFDFIFADFAKQPVEFNLSVPGSFKIRDVTNTIRERLGIPTTSDIVFVKLEKNAIKQRFSPNASLKHLRESSTQPVAYECAMDENLVSICVLFREMQQSKKRGQQPTSKSLSFPRILTLNKNSSLQETHKEIFKTIYPSLGLDSWREDLFAENFPQLAQSGQASSIYDIFISKPDNSQAFYYNKKKLNEICPFCEFSDCRACVFPYDPSINLGDMVARNKTNPLLTLEVVLNSPNNKQITERLNDYQKIGDPPASASRGGLTLQDWLEFENEEKQLERGNEWYCRQCQTHVQATKKMQFQRLPNNFIVQIKRFKQRGHYIDKDNKQVSFPVVLDLSRYISESSEDTQTQYQLYGVVNHFGTMTQGHYTAFCQNGDFWYEFNDNYVTKLPNEQALVSSSAYILFYKRMES